jgi:hypothetical protein
MVLAILRRGFTLGLRRNSMRMEPMRSFTQRYIAVLILTSLAAGNAWAQREAKVEANLKSLANGETKTGSGPESPGAGLQGTRNPTERYFGANLLHRFCGNFAGKAFLLSTT